MRLLFLITAAVLAMGAFDLAQALATRDGVGPLEYALGGVLTVLLAVAALRFGRRTLRQRS